MNRSQFGPPGAAGTGASGAWERRQMWRGFMGFFFAKHEEYGRDKGGNRGMMWDVS
jgi:hypothetical protein